VSEANSSEARHNGETWGWTTSLERKDVYRGYMKDNVCLICMEFQAQDCSVVMKKVNTSTGWNKEKFKLFLDSVTKKYHF
jgi:hypothetical protein